MTFGSSPPNCWTPGASSRIRGAYPGSVAPMTLRTRALGATAALAVAAGIGTAAAPAQPGHVRAAAEQKITGKGVGNVRVGARYSTLHRKRLVGRLRGGCPLGGPGARTARLRAPLVG